jgi:hypothetical protein
LTVTKQNYKCGTCGQPTLTISKHARVPKKGAKRAEWKKLFKHFPHILSDIPRTRALIKLGFQK